MKAPTTYKILEALRNKGFLYFARDPKTGFFIRLIERAGSAEIVMEVPIAGKVGLYGEVYDFSSNIGHFASVFVGVASDAVFALAVTADIPQASLQVGDWIIFDLNKKPQAGDICIGPIGLRFILIRTASKTIDQGMTFTSTTQTFGEFLTTWLSSAKSSIRPRSWLHYEQLARTYVLPNLGQIKTKNLRPDQIRRLNNHLFSTDVGSHTVIKIHAMLHSALEQAVKVGLVNRNATNAAISPSEPIKEMKILEESQVSQLLIAARGSRMEALLHLAISTGMRQMEILGLKWTNLDWIKKILKIERQLVRGEGVQFSQPKTKNGRRIVVLGDKTIETLRRHYDRQNEERRKSGENWKEHGLIFTSANGSPIQFRLLMRQFKNLLKAAGLPEIVSTIYVIQLLR